MHYNFLLIGQGIAGTFLSYYLEKRGCSFLIIDNNIPSSASRVAAGIINPVTGRRFVETWMIDQLLPEVQQSYEEIGKAIGSSVIEQLDIIEFFPNPFMREMFLQRIAESAYLQLPKDENDLRSEFNYDLGYGIIGRSLLVQVEKILPLWRSYLLKKGWLLDETFDRLKLNIDSNSITYGNITADHLIFCNGTDAASDPLFRNLPFAFNKGESFLVEINELKPDHIYKKGINLVPTAQKDIFWVGSNYLWKFDDDQPSEAFRKSITSQLQQWLKVPFKIIDHRASIRPATIERRPFVGMHPKYPRVGILNGLGTKGCSLAPHFAKQLVAHLLDKEPLNKEADIRRFESMLQRKIEE